MVDLMMREEVWMRKWMRKEVIKCANLRNMKTKEMRRGLYDE